MQQVSRTCWLCHSSVQTPVHESIQSFKIPSFHSYFTVSILDLSHLPEIHSCIYSSTYIQMVNGGGSDCVNGRDLRNLSNVNVSRVVPVSNLCIYAVELLWYVKVRTTPSTKGQFKVLYIRYKSQASIRRNIIRCSGSHGYH